MMTVDNDVTVGNFFEDNDLKPPETLHISAFIFHDPSFGSHLVDVLKDMLTSSSAKVKNLTTSFFGDSVILMLDWPELDSLMEKYYSDEDMYRGSKNYNGRYPSVNDDVPSRRTPHMTVIKEKVLVDSLAISTLKDWSPTITHIEEVCKWIYEDGTISKDVTITKL